MSWLLKVANFSPLVLWDIINFTFFRCFVRIFGSNSINVIFGFIFKFPVKMSQLMSRPRSIHRSFLFYAICFFIYYISVIWKYESYIIFFLFTSYKKYLVLSLNWSEFLRQQIRISDRNFNSGLSVKLMNEKRFLFLVIIVHPGFNCGQNIIWLKANDIT